MSAHRSVASILRTAGLLAALGGLALADPPADTGKEKDGPAARAGGEPRPAAPTPDDPPHEGAMVEVPYVIAAPDLLTVEVLQALPGRPISGERLVRPDGTISLGFYGEVRVGGLTPREAKVKVIEHLRATLDDPTLGLVADPAAPPPVPEGTPRRRPRPPVSRPEAAGPPVAAPEPARIEPAKSGRVFVDVTAYNSKFYYAQGDFAAPGRLPLTGNETVLDALNLAGGLTPPADPRSLRLIRPGRDGKPPRVYPVDLQAVTEKGETRTNYQIFPGDRIIVSRAAVKEQAAARPVTTEGTVDALIDALTSSAALADRLAGLSPHLNAEDRETLRKGVAAFWAKTARHPEAVGPEAEALRGALLKLLKANDKGEPER